MEVFSVLSPPVLAEIQDDACMFEQEPMQSLASKSQVRAFLHRGFWQPMDTLRDKQRLEELWASGKALCGKHGSLLHRTAGS